MPAKILVVDDEPSLKSIINQKFRNKITKKDLKFIFASNSFIALEQLQAEPDIDIILTDITIPKIDGLALLSTLYEINHPTLKTIIISDSSDLTLVRKAMNLGAFDLLTKPIDLEDLEITVNKTINYVQKLKDSLKQKSEIRRLENELEDSKQFSSDLQYCSKDWQAAMKNLGNG